jgi:hypothetical protein
MTVIKPLQAICSHGACRRRQIVPADRIWYIDVRKGPGTHREAGWACRFCGTENATLPSHLPRGTIAMLPSRQQVLDLRKPATRPERRKVSPDPSVPVASKPRTLPVPAMERPGEMPVPTCPDTGIGTGAITPSARSVGEGAIATGPIDRIDAEGKDKLEFDRVGGSDPTWVVGRPAKAALTEALARIACHGGHAVALMTGQNGFEVVDVLLPEQKRMNDAEIAASAHVVLEDLESRRAEVLVLGGSVHGRPWQAIMHVSAGAASFV